MIIFKGDLSIYFTELLSQSKAAPAGHSAQYRFPKVTAESLQMGNALLYLQKKRKRCLQKQRDSLGAIESLRFNYLSTELQVSMLQRYRTNKAITPRSPPFSPLTIAGVTNMPRSKNV